MAFNGKTIYAMKPKFDKEYGDIPKFPGIYLWTRFDKDINKTYFYVGQAKNLYNRRFDYYLIKCGITYPTRWFEYSLKAHDDGAYQVIEYCSESELDAKEQYGIKFYQRKDNYITRNESLTGKDTVKTNSHRIQKIKKEYQKSLKDMLSHLDVKINGKLVIAPKTNKDGSLNKLSADRFQKLKEMLNEINKIQ